MNEADVDAHADVQLKTNEDEENGMHDIQNDDSVLINKDVPPSMSNPLRGVGSPFNFESSSDDVVKHVTTNKNYMVGVFTTHDNEIPTNESDVSELKWDPKEKDESTSHPDGSLIF